MKKVLLINPWICDFSCFDLWLKPLGLLYIASILREENFQIFFIDCLDKYYLKEKTPKVNEYGVGKFPFEFIKKPDILSHIPRRYKKYGIPREYFIEKLKQIPNDIQAILITSLMTYWYQGVLDVIEIVKEFFKDVPIILGGKYPTLCYEHCKKNSGADFFVKGEGEIEILKLLDKLTGSKSNYEKYSSIDDFPLPSFNLINKLDYVCILTSRGCPYRCTYCATYNLHKNFVQRNPEKVFDEIEFYYKKYKIKNFAFYDDALLINKESHIKVILKKVINKNLRINFHTPNALHLKEVDFELAKLLYQSGFKILRFGLETKDETRQKDTGGKINNEEFIRGISYLKEAGFTKNDLGIYILIGLPNQTQEELYETINFVNECGAKPILAEYSPIPGTKDFELAKKEFILNPELAPVLQNNSLLPYQSKVFDIKKFNEIKNFYLRHS